MMSGFGPATERHCEPEGRGNLLTLSRAFVLRNLNLTEVAAPFGLAMTLVLFGGSGDFAGQELLPWLSANAKSISYAGSPPRKITTQGVKRPV